jgi:hypothetical protein
LVVVRRADRGRWQENPAQKYNKKINDINAERQASYGFCADYFQSLPVPKISWEFLS